MSQTIVWTRRALRRLDEIGAYIAVDNADAADRVVGRIVSAIDQLGNQPALGRPGRLKATRELVLVDIPYIVPYRVTVDTVEVLTVMHSSQQWPSKL
jgi:addiction module RelE/StbE family toxin